MTTQQNKKAGSLSHESQVESLRYFCNTLHRDRNEELRDELTQYFKKKFILGHKPWHAVIGNKRCKPVPIYKSFHSQKNGFFFKWPNMSEKLIREQLEELGFVVTKGKIRISVPKPEVGQELTFAQNCVKEINYSYSKHCETEKKSAELIFSDLLKQMLEAPDKDIKTHSDYTLFYNIKFELTSWKCLKYFNRLMEHYRIERYYEGDKFIGLKVLN